MMTTQLPDENGLIREVKIKNKPLPVVDEYKFSRTAFAAAHIVSDPFKTPNPVEDVAIDWEKTIQYRRYLWSLGLGVAEAMDTAQRGMGLDWKNARQLIRHSIAASKDFPSARLASGCGTDHLTFNSNTTINEIVSAYEEQVNFVQQLGGQTIIMASRALAAVATSPDDYHFVYGKILSQLDQPAILHWLGEMFDPALAGYWGSPNHREAMETLLAIIEQHQDKIDGVKISLLLSLIHI